MSRAVDAVIVHCTASSWGDVGAVREWHTLPPPRGNGWTDIGYHFVILNGWPRAWRYDPEAIGQVQPGRPVEQRGAHAAGHNRTSIGVCLVGPRVVDGEPDFPDEQVTAAVRLVAELCRRHRVRLSRVLGHSELPGVEKQCPVIDMADFRARVGQELANNGDTDLVTR